jgi:hypothetical protein
LERLWWCGGRWRGRWPQWQSALPNETHLIRSDHVLDFKHVKQRHMKKLPKHRETGYVYTLVKFACICIYIYVCIVIICNEHIKNIWICIYMIISGVYVSPKWYDDCLPVAKRAAPVSRTWLNCKLMQNGARF